MTVLKWVFLGAFCLISSVGLSHAESGLGVMSGKLDLSSPSLKAALTGSSGSAVLQAPRFLKAGSRAPASVGGSGVKLLPAQVGQTSASWRLRTYLHETPWIE